MDTRTGEIRQMSDEEVQALEKSHRGRRNWAHGDPVMIPIDPANLSPRARMQLERTGRTQVSRNSPCPCGSRKRFKRCCMTK